MTNKFSTVSIKTETLERIRKLAEIRNTTVPRMIDELVLDYEMDKRAIAEMKDKDK